MESIGKRIKERRKNLGLKQSDISEKTSLSQSSVSDIEKGKYIPNGAILLEISNLLNCSVDWLLTGKENSSLNYQNFENIILSLQEIIKETYDLNSRDKREICEIIKKFKKLPEDKHKEILNFIDFLSENERKEGSGASSSQNTA